MKLSFGSFVALLAAATTTTMVHAQPGGGEPMLTSEEVNGTEAMEMTTMDNATEAMTGMTDATPTATEAATPTATEAIAVDPGATTQTDPVCAAENDMAKGFGFGDYNDLQYGFVWFQQKEPGNKDWSPWFDCQWETTGICNFTPLLEQFQAPCTLLGGKYKYCFLSIYYILFFYFAFYFDFFFTFYFVSMI